MQYQENSFDELSRVLFDGEAKAWDFKTMAGPLEDATPDAMAHALLASMERVGLIKCGVLVDKNN